ncbi:carbon-nitrogen family hydrolase [Anaerosinus massiliensis]|uniref:carbon-nitrogen family hydrolase n=1 Tax=Massilibacillus massiliensis TaxID=1806837 RepID=UPI000DA61090|nr:carbon-nitrogen family hydrolase [Massilibacillus massiliensis]
MKKRISLIQMDVAFAKPEENYQRAVQLMENAMKEKPDIIVFPETMNVGFFPKEGLSTLADVDGEKTKEVFGAFASAHHVNIVAGSVANKKEGNIYNTLYVFNRLGEVVGAYDKVHGFTPSDEHHYFKGGNKVIHFSLDGIKCSCVICYDMRFPEFIRTATLQGVDLMFIPAQWPLARKLHWVTLATARAIENQMYVCAVNACGYAGETKYGGNSLLINPWGEPICHMGTEEEIQTGEIDMEMIQGIRESINIFRDRKPAYYKVD